MSDPYKNYPQNRPMPHPGAPRPSDVDLCPYCKGTGVDDPEFDGWDDEGWKSCHKCKGSGMNKTNCDHEWETLWDDEVGQECRVCMICGDEAVFQYDPEKRNLENRIDYLEHQLQLCADVLNVFAQFADIKAHQHEHVTISVPIDVLKEARHLLGGAFRDFKSSENIPY